MPAELLAFGPVPRPDLDGMHDCAVRPTES